MKIKFWGTRGSIAKPGPTTARYGGNTSCVELHSDSGTFVVIDCGTGGHALGQQLVKENKGAINGHMLISHTHWDHIQGIPFFAPLFIPGNEWEIYGPKGLWQSLRAALAGQMEHTYFPVALDQFAAKIQYHDIVEGTFSIGDIKITTRYLNHPALTLGYRFEADGATFVYCCDHEPHSAALASGESVITGVDRRYADFIANADLVVHDAQYTAKEYAAKVGWGHSPVEYAIRVCQDAGVKKVALTHHDPLRDDDSIDRILAEVRARLTADGSALEVVGASEGLTIQVSGHSDRTAERPKGFGAETAIDDAYVSRPVLLFVPDKGMAAILAEAVSSEGLPCAVVSDVKELLRKAADDPPSLIVIEHAPPTLDGQDVARSVRRNEGARREERIDKIAVPILLVTSADSSATRETGVATDWMVAPFSLSYARTKIRAWALRSACRWIRAKLPAGESRRLAALHDLAILDTPPEERFDRVTRIAAAAFAVPIAMVSLVDGERQWFKSCVGMKVSETSRDVALCSHVVQLREELVVADTLLDDRFADNPLVLESPRIRFYAGAPLILADGHCVGTLCLIDTRPRELSEEDRSVLRDLRDIALEEIVRKRAA